MTLNEFQSMRPDKRLAYAKAHPAFFEGLGPADLERAGTLLCHAASASLRERMPIDEELNETLQSKFEQQVSAERASLDSLKHESYR